MLVLLFTEDTGLLSWFITCQIRPSSDLTLKQRIVAMIHASLCHLL